MSATLEPDPNDTKTQCCERAKQKMLATMNECRDRFAEARGDPSFANAALFDLSITAAELAPKLGFSAPPIESIVIRRPDWHPLLKEYPDCSDVCVLRFNDPGGLTHVSFDLAVRAEADEPAPACEPVSLPPPKPAAIDAAGRVLRSWCRMVERCVPEAVELADASITNLKNSVQGVLFGLALIQQRRGGGLADHTKSVERRSLLEMVDSPEFARAIEEQATAQSKKYRFVAIARGAPETDIAKARDQLKREKLDRQEVKERLQEMYDRCDEWTSQRTIAKKLGCSHGLVATAIKDSPKPVQAWASRSRKVPRATELNDVIVENTIQQRELDPANVLSAEDKDRLWNRILEKASPGERAKLEAKTPEERSELVRLFQEQEEYLDPSSLEADPPGKAPLGVKAHKRV